VGGATDHGAARKKAGMRRPFYFFRAIAAALPR
jgi:hypothetical protein